VPARQTIFQLRISLRDVEPEVWRRVLVNGSGALAATSDELITAMGWANSHLHALEVGDTRYGMADDDAPEDELDESEVSAKRALGDVDAFVLEYDFGDGWEHDVVIEAVREVRAGLKFAVCLDGANACPPDDCGGPGGYARLTDVDRTAFDLVATNVEVQRLR
jgi:hypothetical protein